MLKFEFAVCHLDSTLIATTLTYYVYNITYLGLCSCKTIRFVNQSLTREVLDIETCNILLIIVQLGKYASQTIVSCIFCSIYKFCNTCSNT